MTTGNAPARSPGGQARPTRSSCARRPACAGRPSLPGDKSISHRALLLALLAEGESRITAAGDGEDVRSTAGIVAALGAHGGAAGERDGRVDYRVVSPGGDALTEPERRPRLRQLRDDDRACVAGLLAGPRPVRRARRRRLAPPAADGPGRGAAARDGRGVRRPPTAARCCRSRSPGRARLDPIDYATPVPSAQVKSAILLAGPRRRRRDRGDRGRRDPRPHRADAPRPRRGRGGDDRRRRRPHRAPRRARPGPPPSTRPCPPTRPAPRSGWSPARSTRTRSFASRG